MIIQILDKTNFFLLQATLQAMSLSMQYKYLPSSVK